MFPLFYLYFPKDAGDVLLASAGQDMLIRIWRLSSRNSGNSNHKNSSFDPKKEIKLEEEIFSVETGGVTHHWAAILDSVLAGHEGWVYSVCWHPEVSDGRNTILKDCSSL